MRTNCRYRVLMAACMVCSYALPVQAITISVQYPSGTLFHPAADGTAKAAINAAAADISWAITSMLDPIVTDRFTGTSGSTSATFDWSYAYTDPSTGQLTVVNSATALADRVTVYVGARALDANDIGVAGPGTYGFSASLTSADQAQAAIDATDDLSEQALLRGGGPVVGTVAGPLDFGSGFVFNSSVDYGVAVGSVSFDNDSDNNGVTDNAAELDAYWHWNHTTNVASGKNDLYTVAMHEILHTLGFGISNTWDEVKSGTTWNGSEVQAITGSGAGLVQSSGGHVTSNLMSKSIYDGTPGELLMDPSATPGTRKELTTLDLAFLRDLGYETLTFDPADFNVDGTVDAADLSIFENWHGFSGWGDTNADGDTDGSDLLIWQRHYTVAAAATVAVPEPIAVWLVAAALVMACSSRQRVC